AEDAIGHRRPDLAGPARLADAGAAAGAEALREAVRRPDGAGAAADLRGGPARPALRTRSGRGALRAVHAGRGTAGAAPGTAAARGAASRPGAARRRLRPP